jgi:hypothetical protein
MESGSPFMSPPKQRLIIASITDRIGGTIVLEHERWEHICKRHRQLDGYEIAVMTAIENADKTKMGNTPNSRVIYAEGIGPARWLAVVVEYDGLNGHVVTAYPFSKEPRADA